VLSGRGLRGATRGTGASFARQLASHCSPHCCSPSPPPVGRAACCAGSHAARLGAGTRRPTTASHEQVSRLLGSAARDVRSACGAFRPRRAAWGSGAPRRTRRGGGEGEQQWASSATATGGRIRACSSRCAPQTATRQHTSTLESRHSMDGSLLGPRLEAAGPPPPRGGRSSAQAPGWAWRSATRRSPLVAPPATPARASRQLLGDQPLIIERNAASRWVRRTRRGRSTTMKDGEGEHVGDEVAPVRHETGKCRTTA